ncbi:MAG: FG-GAP-like repeat-containing protein [Polyangiales bacterium]
MKGKGVRWANLGIWLIALGFSGCLSWCSPCSCACTSACGGSLCGASGCGGGIGSGCGGGCGAGGGCSSSSSCSRPTNLIPDAAPRPDADTRCIPECGARRCGPDPRCGQPCGACADGNQCDFSGACVPLPLPSPTRLIAPLSGSRVASHRPRLQWTLGSDADAARVEVCADRDCTRVIEAINSASTTANPSELPRGVYFWRVTALRGGLEAMRSATWEFFVGAENTNPVGIIGSVFDCNGDGLADVAIASPGRMEEGGSVRVYLGSRTELFDRPQRTLPRTHFGDGFASSVASAGDVDGDGFSDLVVGASRAVLGGDSPGATGGAFIYHGDATGITERVSVLSPTRDAQQFGKLVAGLGDVDRDGYSDVAVVSNAEIMVFFGHSSTVRFGRIATIPAPRTTDPVASLAAVSDTDGDQFMDALVTNATRRDGARSLWLDGTFGWTAPEMSAALAPPFTSSALVAASTGDLNGDGLADLAIGDPLDTGSSPVARGRVALFYSVAAPQLTPNQLLDGPAILSRFGWSIASAGDLDNDGFDELFVGAPGVYDDRASSDAGLDASLDDGAALDGGALCSSGYVAIHRGSAAGVSAAPSWTFRGGRDQCSTIGAHVSFVGDLNGDGFNDVLIGDPNARVADRARSGRVFVVLGASPFDLAPSRTIEGTSDEQRLGASIAGGT